MATPSEEDVLNRLLLKLLPCLSQLTFLDSLLGRVCADHQAVLKKLRALEHAARSRRSPPPEIVEEKNELGDLTSSIDAALAKTNEMQTRRRPARGRGHTKPAPRRPRGRGASLRGARRAKVEGRDGEGPQSSIVPSSGVPRRPYRGERGGTNRRSSWGAKLDRLPKQTSRIEEVNARVTAPEDAYHARCSTVARSRARVLSARKKLADAALVTKSRDAFLSTLTEESLSDVSLTESPVELRNRVEVINKALDAAQRQSQSLDLDVLQDLVEAWKRIDDEASNLVLGDTLGEALSYRRHVLSSLAKSVASPLRSPSRPTTAVVPPAVHPSLTSWLPDDVCPGADGLLAPSCVVTGKGRRILTYNTTEQLQQMASLRLELQMNLLHTNFEEEVARTVIPKLEECKAERPLALYRVAHALLLEEGNRLCSVVRTTSHVQRE